MTIEPQICGGLNLKFVEYLTSNLWKIEPQMTIEPQICGGLNLKFFEY
jgi:hypothetical protein